MLHNRLLTGIAVVLLTAVAIVIVILLLVLRSSSSSPKATSTPLPISPTPSPAVESTDTLDAHKAAIRRVIEDVFSDGDVEAIKTLYTEDFVAHLPPSQTDYPELSRPDLEEIVLLLREGMPDLEVTPEIVVAEGDYVAVRATLRGTFASEFYDYPPTGLPVELSFTVIHRFAASGAIAEAWVTYDTLALRRALGQEIG
ncbi:MAG: ester cyclase [Aggregatilineaceae bacterium]